MRRWLLLLGLAACDGDPPEVMIRDAGAANVDAAPVALDPVTELATAIAVATCEKVDLCCPGAERSRVIGVGDNRASCETSFGAFYGRQYGGIAAAISGGRVRFDTQQLAKCIASYRAAGCRFPGVSSARECTLVLTGSTENGAACESGLDCSSHYCAAAAVAADGKQCLPRKADGRPCARNFECQSGFCKMLFASGTCSAMPDARDSCGGDGFWLGI